MMADREVPTSLQSWPPTRREISPALASLGLDRQMSRQWKWCKARGREAETEILRGLLEKYVDALMLFVLEGKDGDELVTPPRQTIPITNLNMVTQLCKQIDIALVDRDELTDAATLEAIFIYAATWSCGAAILENIVVQDRTRFDKLLKSLSGLNSSDGQSVPLSNVPQKSLFDYYLDIDAAMDSSPEVSRSYEELDPKTIYKRRKKRREDDKNLASASDCRVLLQC